MRVRIPAAAILLLLSSCARADFTFAHITDLHVTADAAAYSGVVNRAEDWPATTARWSSARQAIIDGVNREKPDFVVVTGDLTELGLGFEYTSLIEWINKIEAPVYMIPGNHDVIWRGQLPHEAPTRGRSLLNYERVFGRSWYSFNYGNAHFVLLNSMVDDREAPAAYKKSGGEQVNWLRRELRYARNAGFPFVFALQHHGLAVTPRISKALSEGGVSATLFGHIHRHTAGSHQGVMQISGTSVKGGSSGINQPSYGLVRVTADSATYQLYNPSGAPIFDPVVIPRAPSSDSTLWDIRSKVFPELPESTHDELLSVPY